MTSAKVSYLLTPPILFCIRLRKSRKLATSRIPYTRKFHSPPAGFVCRIRRRGGPCRACPRPAPTAPSPSGTARTPTAATAPAARQTTRPHRRSRSRCRNRELSRPLEITLQLSWRLQFMETVLRSIKKSSTNIRANNTKPVGSIGGLRQNSTAAIKSSNPALFSASAAAKIRPSKKAGTMLE